MLPRNRIQLYYVPVKAIGSILSKKSPHPYFVDQHVYYILKKTTPPSGEGCGVKGGGGWEISGRSGFPGG